MSIHIITHCYAETLIHYSIFLRCHLSSLVIHRPKTEIRVSICCHTSDQKTMEVVQDFVTEFDFIDWCGLSKGELFRRSIGRNIFALKTTSEIVWFCDTDHVFGAGCLDRLQEIWNGFDGDKPAMCYPKTIQIHRNHEVGDQFWRDNLNSNGLIDINPDDFIPKTNHKAIGGIQIVDGDFARQYGYLEAFPKWRQPTDGTKPFPDFRDDVKYRRFCASQKPLKPIDLPNLYRLRHSEITYR